MVITIGFLIIMDSLLCDRESSRFPPQGRHRHHSDRLETRIRLHQHHAGGQSVVERRHRQTRLTHRASTPHVCFQGDLVIKCLAKLYPLCVSLSLPCLVTLYPPLPPLGRHGSWTEKGCWLRIYPVTDYWPISRLDFPPHRGGDSELTGKWA